MVCFTFILIAGNMEPLCFQWSRWSQVLLQVVSATASDTWRSCPQTGTGLEKRKVEIWRSCRNLFQNSPIFRQLWNPGSFKELCRWFNLTLHLRVVTQGTTCLSRDGKIMYLAPADFWRTWPTIWASCFGNGHPRCSIMWSHFLKVESNRLKSFSSRTIIWSSAQLKSWSAPALLFNEVGGGYWRHHQGGGHYRGPDSENVATFDCPKKTSWELIPKLKTLICVSFWSGIPSCREDKNGSDKRTPMKAIQLAKLCTFWTLSNIKSIVHNQLGVGISKFPISVKNLTDLWHVDINFHHMNSNSDLGWTFLSQTPFFCTADHVRHARLLWYSNDLGAWYDQEAARNGLQEPGGPVTSPTTHGFSLEKSTGKRSSCEKWVFVHEEWPGYCVGFWEKPLSNWAEAIDLEFITTPDGPQVVEINSRYSASASSIISKNSRMVFFFFFLH